MSLRRLAYHQILDVLHCGHSKQTGDRLATRLRGLRTAIPVLDETGKHALPGTYIPVAAGVILPKKRGRGEKFLVRYTEVRKKEF